MKKIFLIPLIFFAFFSVADAQVFRPMTARYNNLSVKGNIVYVANNTATTPLAITTEAPPGGTATNNANPGVNIDIDTDVPAHTSKIAFGNVWNYHSQGVAPANNPLPTDWKQPAYVLNPLTWNVGAIPVNGAGKYGYSNPLDLSITTCIKSSAAATACVPAAGAKYTAYYFRNTVNFTAAELAAYHTIIVNMKRNDGIVVYVNGVERIRNNMPAGAVGYGTLASADIPTGAAENLTRNLNPAFFAVGANSIAVEIHVRAAATTNMSFDMEMLGVDTAATFSSTSADLNLNSCSQILWAGLYWGGNHQSGVGGDTTYITGETMVKLKVPGSAVYQTVTSTQNDYHNSTRVPGLNHAGYFCFADITSFLNAANPNGTYTIGNVVAPVGFNSCGAGWTIAIAYSNPTEIQRNLTIFDGSAVVKIGNPAMYVSIAGFLTPPAGPVSCELGVVAYDGDRGALLTDEFYFKQDSNRLVGAYTNLTPNATSNLNDMFNSTISNKGVVAAARNPAHNNTHGYDADIIEIPNPGNVLLGNSQISASIRFSSTVEDFFVQVVTTAISIYNPSFAFDKSATDLSGGSLTPGDSLRYTMSYDNVGNDASTNSRIIDNIPAGTAFKAGSLRINGVAKTDAAGDDQAEYDFANNRIVYRLGVGANAVVGGEIAADSSGNVTFDIYAPASCTILSCSGTLRNRARMTYGGKLSLLSLQDSSGVYNAGCIDPVDKIDIVAGTCMPLGDTILANICPTLTINIPVRRYAGYAFHSGIPFTPANAYNPATPVTFTRIIYAYYDAPGACPDDTIRINIFITACPDIDDDNDGIPDYVELDNPVALQDAAPANGIPNWNDPTYPGFIDNNTDGFNDNFDPSADSDNDAIPNFIDPTFPGWVDSNSDGVNDNMDKDLDGIPNHLDLDSDNDGVPDTVESFGVDANGDGRIDNYSDTDNDGLSQNVDGSAGGVASSGLALGALDTDGDGIGNYLDLDSDNDGIPDITEAFGTDAANSAKVNVFADTDGDGYADALDADVGNDLVAENSAASLLKTSADGNGDGRTDSWPFKNMDSDSKPNPYDLDSDGDGITDVKEAQFTDADWNGQVDGAINTNGRNTALAGLPSLTIPNTDGIGRTNPYDIDSDEDGIPDNVEGLTTLGYLLPSGLDTDVGGGDGIDDTYDNFNGFGGDGIHPVNTDADLIPLPDYLDLDTDNDGLIDRVEGNDLNFNGLQDDNVTLTGTDTDGDGLDDRFDNNNSSAEATSAYMGNGGSTSGDPSPGSITTVQHTTVPWGCATERDWRCVFYILSCDIISFKAVLQNQQVKLDWTVFCKQEADQFIVQRSMNGTSFTDVAMIAGRPVINEAESYTANDDITLVNADILYYRLITILKNGKRSISNIISIRTRTGLNTDIQVLPNPVRDNFQLVINSAISAIAEIHLIDGNGKTLQTHKEQVYAGSNSFTFNWTKGLPSGLYYLQVNLGTEFLKRKLYVIK